MILASVCGRVPVAPCSILRTVAIEIPDASARSDCSRAERDVPNLNLYVSDSLRKRMDATGGTINWSEIVRPAILRAVADFECHFRGSLGHT